MLVITANWAFTDGSLWQPPAARQCRWLDDVHRAALRGGFGRDGIYRPIDAIDIVFAGDTFDVLASRHWTGAVKPWHGGLQARTTRAAVMFAAARRSRRLFAVLGRWTRHGLAVPAADRRGRPQSQRTQRAQVRVTFLTGDRDRWLDEAAPFAHRRGHAIGRTWATTDLVVLHGAELDPLWTTGAPDGDADARTGERQPLLGESLAVDLVARFAATVLDRLPSRPAVRSLLAAVGSSRVQELPAVLARRLAATPGRESPPADVRDAIRSSWNRSLAAWHREVIRRPPACGLEACPVDALAAWLEAAATPAARVAATIALLQPRPGRGRSTARATAGRAAASGLTTVLGHVVPPAAGSDSTAADLVCLGGPGARTLVRGRHEPSTWEPLEAEAATAAVIGPGGAVAGGSGDGDTVVDAIPDAAFIDAVGHAA